VVSTETIKSPEQAEAAAEGITMSEEAKTRLRRLIARKAPDNPKMCLRVGVRGGGCSGLNYFMDLDDKISDRWDVIFQVADDLRVVCDKKSLIYLKGSEVVWSGNLLSGGFAFENPNAEKSCGCGTSFSIA